MTVTNEALQAQITSLDQKVDDRHDQNTEALKAIGQKMDTLIELNLGQKLQGQLISQLSEKAKEQDKSLVEFYRRLGKAEAAISTHSWAWKIVGTVLLTALGGTGWMLVQMKEFYQDFYHMDDRVGTLEFLVQGRTTPILPPAQTTSRSK